MKFLHDSTSSKMRKSAVRTTLLLGVSQPSMKLIAASPTVEHSRRTSTAAAGKAADGNSVSAGTAWGLFVTAHENRM